MHIPDRLALYSDRSDPMMQQSIRSGKMKGSAHVFRWFTLALLFSWAGLSVFGAFLGADRAKLLFTAWPMAVYWTALALTLLAGFAVFASLRRSPALAAAHLGLVLIIAGFGIGSETGHRAAARLTGRRKIPWSYLVLREGQVSDTVVDRSLRREVGRLPFRVRLDTFDIEHYPPRPDPPPLFLGVLDPEPGSPHPSWRARPLAWKPGRGKRIDGTPIRFRVREFTLADTPGVLQVRLTLTDGDAEHEREMKCAPGERFGRLALRPLFPDTDGLAPTASLLLAPPEPTVRLYRSRVTILDNGRDTRADILVNRPVRFGGYHFYQHSWGEHHGRYTVLLVVSDSGLPVIYAGFLLLGGGVTVRYWRPRRPSGCGEGQVA